MSTKNPSTVQTHLAERAQGSKSGDQLVFDPTTGELVLTTPQEARPSQDAAVIDQIAEDGFFGGRS